MKTTNPKNVKYYSILEICSTRNHDLGSHAIVTSQSNQTGPPLLKDLIKSWAKIKLEDYARDRWISPFTYKIITRFEPYEILTQQTRCKHPHYIYLYQYKTNHPEDNNIYELELCIHEINPSQTFQSPKI